MLNISFKVEVYIVLGASYFLIYNDVYAANTTQILATLAARAERYAHSLLIRVFFAGLLALCSHLSARARCEIPLLMSVRRG